MKQFLLYSTFLFATFSFSQVGIGTTTPDPSSILDITATDKGLLIPRVALTAITASGPVTAPQTGLMVYNTATANTGAQAVSPGFHFWDGAKWSPVQIKGGERNIFNSDGALPNSTDRILNLNSRALVFKNGNNDAFKFPSNGRLQMPAYGNGAIGGIPTNILSVDNQGNVIEIPQQLAYNAANQDWYEAGTNRAPDAITDDIYTLGNVGIGTTSPSSPLYIFQNDNLGDSSGGTLTLAHGSGNASSIIFRSGVNGNSDYGYIRYEDNATAGGSTENSLMTIGVENDIALTSTVDNININSSGNLGINNPNPNGSASIDMGRSNQGLLVNRVALINASNAGPINNPASGLLVYNTSSNLNPLGYKDDVRPGFYYWNGTRWTPQKAENRSARWTNTDVTFNLHLAGDELPIFGNNSWNDDAGLYSVPGGNNDVIVAEDGRYHIIASIAIKRTDNAGNRSNIDARLERTRNGVDTFLGATSSANYIRNADNHNNSTIFINEIVELNAGDDISIYVSGETTTGNVVTMRSVGDANFTITKIM